MENNEEIKGWSWLGFLFMPYYYAGYGELKKGIVLSIIAGLMAGVQTESSVVILIIILVGLSIAVYGGLNGRKELPIKKQKFSWKNVMIAIGVYIVAMVISTMLFLSVKLDTPNCNDVETKQLVKEIALKEFKQEGVSQVKLSLTSIRTSGHDEKVDKYECEAELIGINEINADKYKLDITYTSQMTEDDEHFYVEVFGL